MAHVGNTVLTVEVDNGDGKLVKVKEESKSKGVTFPTFTYN